MSKYLSAKPSKIRLYDEYALRLVEAGRDSSLAYKNGHTPAGAVKATVPMGSKKLTGWSTEYRTVLGWTQPKSRKYGYQVQHCFKYRKAPSSTDEGGWTAWSAWSDPSGNNSGSNASKYANVSYGVDKSHAVKLSHDYDNDALGRTDIDGLKIKVRVRCYSKSAKKWSKWATQVFTVRFKPNVKTTALMRTDEGGLRIVFSSDWERGGATLNVSKITYETKAGKRVKLNQSKLSLPCEDADPSTEHYVDIPASALKRSPKPGEALYFDSVWFQTADGAKKALAGGTVAKVVKVAEWDDPEDTGGVAVGGDAAVFASKRLGEVTAVAEPSTRSLLVTVKPDAEVVKEGKGIDYLTCWCETATVDDDGLANGVTARRVGWSERAEGNNGVVTFRFHPPLDVPLVVEANFSTGSTTQIYTQSAAVPAISSGGMMFVHYDDEPGMVSDAGEVVGSRMLALAYDPEASRKHEGVVEKELPFGRSRPVAFLGEGGENDLTLSGTAFEDWGAESTLKRDADRFLRLLARMCTVQLPGGERYKCVCSTGSIQRSGPGAWKVTVEASEVG